MTSGIFAFLVFLSGIPAIKISGSMGIKSTIKLGALFLATGLLLRSLINTNFYFVHIGQIFTGISSALISNAKPKLITEWFHDSRVIQKIKNSEEFGFPFLQWLPL